MHIRFFVLLIFLLYSIFCNIFNLVFLFYVTVLAIGFCVGYWCGEGAPRNEDI